MAHHVTLIPGDGIGPEVCAVARGAIEATGVQIRWDVQDAGAATLEREGTALPRRVLDSIAGNGVALKGPLATTPGHPSPNVALRRELGVYVNIRPVTARPGLAGPSDLDVVVIRMTLEDVMAGIEFAAGAAGNVEVRRLVAEHHGVELADDTGISIKPISATEARRLHEAAFAYAESHGRRRVTSVHKRTTQRATDGLFLETGREVAERHPTIEHDDRLVDAVCHDLVRRPASQDILATPAQYGDILSDLAAGLGGGLGVAPSANFGDGVAVFDAVHGTASRLAGRDKADPFALVGAAAMLLRHLGEADAAERIDAATARLLAAGRPLTYDLDRTGSPASTSEVGAALARAITSDR